MAEQAEAQETRSAYLLDGRRVTIGDLIGAGLLTPWFAPACLEAAMSANRL